MTDPQQTAPGIRRRAEETLARTLHLLRGTMLRLTGRWLTLPFLFATLIGCGSSDRDGSSSEDELRRRSTKYCRVAVVGATIAPMHSSGVPWDGPPFHEQGLSAAKQIVEIVAPQYKTAADLIALVTGRLIEKSQPPDTFGRVEWRAEVRELRKAQDEFVPRWEPDFVTHVPLDETAAVNVFLRDADVGAELGIANTDDQIGGIALKVEDFRAALQAGGRHQISTRHIDDGHIMFVEIVVEPEP